MTCSESEEEVPKLTVNVFMTYDQAQSPKFLILFVCAGGSSNFVLSDRNRIHSSEPSCLSIVSFPDFRCYFHYCSRQDDVMLKRNENII